MGENLWLKEGSQLLKVEKVKYWHFWEQLYHAGVTLAVCWCLCMYVLGELFVSFKTALRPETYI